MTDKKFSFSKFVQEQPEQVDEVMIPTGVIDHDETGKEELDDLLPVLYASIHFQSEHRKNGHTPEDMFDMNLLGNQHLPDLQRKMLEQHASEGNDVSRHAELLARLRHNH